MLQAEDLGQTILYLASLPPRACVNELIISPTWNRSRPKMPCSFIFARIRYDANMDIR